MVTMSSSPELWVTGKVRNRRTSRPKVKTGCLTCKRRHVKCGEERPFCRQCIKFGVDCDGYEVQRSKSITSQTSSGRSSCVLIPSESPKFAIAGDDLELRYFHLYQDQAAAELSGYFESRFWTHIILQESHAVDGIRTSVVALGALYKALLEAGDTCLVETSPAQRRFNVHHCYALEQYQKALRSLKQDAARGRMSRRGALISCLLCVCFEILFGDHDSAMSLAASGTRTLRNERATATITPEVPMSLIPSGDARDPIDEELVQMFARLDVQARLFMRNDPTVVGRVQPSVPLQVPTEFRTLQAGRWWSDIVLQKAVLFHRDALCYKHTPAGDVPPAVLQQQSEHLVNLHKWSTAFRPLFRRYRNQMEKSMTAHGAVMLWVHYLTAYILISSMLQAEETYYDTFHPEFQAIVALSRALLLQEPRGHDLKCLTFDVGVTLGLLIVAIKCRVSATRREAIALLFACRRREGIWDSALAAQIGLWIADMEEAGMGMGMGTGTGMGMGPRGGVVVLPEERRVRVRVVKLVAKKREAVVQCGQRRVGQQEDFNVRRRLITW